MIDFNKIKHLSKKEMDEIFHESLNKPLDKELIEIVKALADK